jgi:predicted nucleic acid-binding protein
MFCYPMDQVGTYERAAKVFFNARRRGITIRSSIDCLIAQIAIENEIPLLHDDQDYLEIAKITPLQFFLSTLIINLM